MKIYVFKSPRPFNILYSTYDIDQRMLIVTLLYRALKFEWFTKPAKKHFDYRLIHYKGCLCYNFTCPGNK